MRIPTAVFISSITMFVSGHDTLADNWEWISERLPEVIPGLEPYKVAHHLDLPLSLSFELFNDQIIETETSTFRQENIFSSTDKVTNWLLFLTIEDHPTFKCPKCDKLRPTMQKVAETL